MRAEVLAFSGLVVLSAVCMLFDIANIRQSTAKKILLFLLICGFFVGYHLFPFAPDYWSYQSSYYGYASDNFEFDDIKNTFTDYGFLWLFTLIKSLGGEYDIVRSVVLILMLGCVYVSMQKYTPYMMSAWFIFLSHSFWTSGVNQVRQGLAIWVFLLSWRYVQERKLLHFIVITIVACFIHKTLVVGFLLYPMNRITWDVQKIITLLGFGVIFYTSNFAEHLLYYGVHFIGFGADKIAAYGAVAGEYAQGVSPVYVIYRTLLITILCLFLLNHKENQFSNMYITACLLGIFFTIIFLDFNSIYAARLSAIYLSCFYFVLPEIYRTAHSIQSKLFAVSIIMAIGLGFFFKNYLLHTL